MSITLKRQTEKKLRKKFSVWRKNDKKMNESKKIWKKKIFVKKIIGHKLE